MNVNVNVRVNVRNGGCEKSIIIFRRLGALRIWQTGWKELVVSFPTFFSDWKKTPYRKSYDRVLPEAFSHIHFDIHIHIHYEHP